MIHSGIDLVSLKKIEEILLKSKKSFLARLCTEGELRDLEKYKSSDGSDLSIREIEKIAGLFSLKEAFSKACGTGIGKFLSFKDIEVSYSSLGQPQVSYLGTHFLELKNLSKCCSVSHQDGFLAAMVIIEGEIK